MDLKFQLFTRNVNHVFQFWMDSAIELVSTYVYVNGARLWSFRIHSSVCVQFPVCIFNKFDIIIVLEKTKRMCI